MSAFTVAILVVLPTWRGLLFLFAAFFGTGFSRSFFMMATALFAAGKRK
jgi:hypothetical protein